MKVILLADVPALGRKDEVKEVSGGYARNFLLPRRLAEPATDAAISKLGAKKTAAEHKKSQELTEHQSAAEKLKSIALSFRVKLGEKGKAFGSVNAAKIQEALARQGIRVEKDWIVQDEPIKTTGEKTVSIQFPHHIKGEVKIVIQPE